MHKKERSRNPVTPDKITTPLLFDMYSFQSDRRLITILSLIHSPFDTYSLDLLLSFLNTRIMK